MRRIIIPSDIELTCDNRSHQLTFTRSVADLVEADPSFSRWPKIEMGVAIVDKLLSAKGHVFLADDEWAAIRQTVHDVPWRPIVAFPAARAGWYRAVIDAEEWVEVDGVPRVLHALLPTDVSDAPSTLTRNA